MRSLAITVLILSSCVAQTPDPTPIDGRISGSVVNEDGKPVPRATVYISQEESSLVDANSLVTHTDAVGRFDFGRKLKHGVYEIHAQKEKDGYPDPTSKFYRPLNFSVQTVQLFGDHPAQKVTVQLKDKAGLLVGKIFDGDTGRLLKTDISFSNVQTGTGRAVMTDGKFSVLIPANTDVIVMTQYIDPGDITNESLFTTKVNLQPGQTMNINVPLYKPSTPSDSHE